MSSYNISPRNGTIFIHKWDDVMEILPHMKMGDNSLLFMYEGIAGIFLFIR